MEKLVQNYTPNPSQKKTLFAADFQVITSFTKPLIFVLFFQVLNSVMQETTQVFLIIFQV